MNSQEESLFTAIVITAVTIGIIILYFFISIIRQQRRNLQLQKESLHVEINAMESERNRIANDLHDDVSPILSVIRFQVNSIQVNNKEDELQIQEASEHLDNLLNKLREISNNLMPASLARKGLVISVGEFLRNVEASARIKISYNHDENLEVPHEKSIHIYRMVQELIHNGIKHAKATEITLQLKMNDRSLVVFYEDNGRGFNFEKAMANSTGFGLRSLKSRADLMDGSLHVESKPEQGAQFLFQIPMN